MIHLGFEHFLQNIGDEPLQFLEVFNSEHFADVSLAQWIAMTPREVVKSVLNLPDDFLDTIRKERNPVVKYKNFEFPHAQNTPQNVCYFKDFNFKAPADPDDKNYAI